MRFKHAEKILKYGSLLILLVFQITLSSAIAIENDVVEVTKTEDASMIVNTYDLFWPLVAGKTRGDKYYSFKRAKENLRGALIFGRAQKTDYYLFLATKRVLEADKLLDLNQEVNSKATLVEAIKLFDKAYLTWDKVTDKENQKQVIDEMNNKINNLNTYYPTLYDKSGDDIKTIVDELREKSNNLQSKM